MLFWYFFPFFRIGYCLFWMSSRLSSSIRLAPFETFLLDVDDSFRFHLLDTLRLFSIFGFQCTDSFLWMFPSSGDGEIRTLDPLLARQVLSQLSYAPIPDGSLVWLFRKSLFQVLFQVFSPPVGLSGLEPPTSRLSGVRSNRLSYKPSLSGPDCFRFPFLLYEYLIVFVVIRQPPALPYRFQHSTIGRLSLNHRVRDENGCLP